MLPISFTCTHCTHRTPYPQLLERKNMDALYFSGLHTLHTLPTPHTLPTSVKTTHYVSSLLFAPMIEYFSD